MLAEGGEHVVVEPRRMAELEGHPRAAAVLLQEHAEDVELLLRVRRKLEEERSQARTQRLRDRDEAIRRLAHLL